MPLNFSKSRILILGAGVTGSALAQSLTRRGAVVAVADDKQIQDLKSTACGYYCTAFILFMNGQKNKNKGFETFVDLFSVDTKKNDKKLYQLLYN